MDATSTSAEPDFSHLQDVMSNFPMIRRYIPFCLFFALPEDAYNTGTTQSQIQSDILSRIRTALVRLSTAFPYLAGQVVIENDTPSKTGTTKVIPLHDTIALTVRDLTHEPIDGSGFPTFTQLQRSGYPFDMLDPLVLAPEVVSTYSSNHGPDVIAPVLLFQANFVAGGLILTISGIHMLMDMTGLGLIIGSFAKACRGEPFSADELAGVNQDRSSAIPLFDEQWEPGPELDDIRTPATASQQSRELSSPPRWVYFDFTASNLASLKEEATRSLGGLVPYISTDDALGAFCWRRVTAARLKRFPPTTQTTFCRVVSVRKYLGLKTYPGHMVDCLCRSVASSALLDEPLGETAARLRLLLLDDENIIQHVRGFATLLHRLEDKSRVVNGALLDPERDFVLSSYANTRCCEVRYGDVLGTPDAARRPKTGAWPGLSYLMPKNKNGDMAVGICVGEADLNVLKEDREFTRYAEYIG